MTPQQIKFRGFRTDNGEPVYGSACSLATDSGIKSCIITYVSWDGTMGFKYQDAIECIDIHPSSLGMFTGLTDRNGKEIYGAIGDNGGDVDQSGRVVVYDRGSFILADKLSGEYALIGDCEFCEIIGNQWEVDNGR